MRNELINRWLVVTLVLLGGLPTLVAAENDDPSSNVTRKFQFEYGASLTNLSPGAKVRVWLPVPPTNEHQTVELVGRELPGKGQMGTDPVYGNKILYFETKAPASGKVPFGVTYLVERQEVRGLNGKAGRALSAKDRRVFLSPNKNVPLLGKQLDLLQGIDLPRPTVDLARVLYDRVDDHVKYDKSRPGYGNGDVNWVCDSRFGNCTDFHSLFISWARAKGLPARFEIGFPLPPGKTEGKIGGYHCWALFHDRVNGWVPVDISEADKHPTLKEYYFGNLTKDRVAFTTGRDIQLVPPQDGPPLNYFVYPYVEVDGKLWPKQNTELMCSFRDIR